MESLEQFFKATAFYNLSAGNLFMDVVAIVFISLAIKKHYEPLLLIPIGIGILFGNVAPAFIAGNPVSYMSVTGEISEGSNQFSVMYYLYFGVRTGIYPALIFLGVGAKTDFTFFIAKPRLVLLGAAAQMSLF